MKNKKITIGLLVSGIEDEYTEIVTKGVMYAARQAEVNLAVLPCKYFDRDLSKEAEIRYEYQYNTIFEYAKSSRLDALVVMSDCIGCYATKERMQNAIGSLKGTPVVLASAKMDGYIGVTYDNFSGIREGLDYLIQKRGCRKFAMMGGPESNTDARERRAAFYSTLKEYGIEVPQRAFVEGNLSMDDTAAFVRLLDQNPDAEAIFCVNDHTALGLYEEMKKRGKTPGKDIYILGYDNIIMAAKVKPSLSSIWADPVALGIESLKLAVKLAQGEEQKSGVLPARFIRRESFGTEEDGSAQTSIAEMSDARVEGVFNDIFYRTRSEGWYAVADKIHGAFLELLRTMKAALRDGAGFSEKEEFFSAVDDFAGLNIIEYADIEKLMYYFERICETLVKKREKKEDAEELRTVYGRVYGKIVDALDVHYTKMQKEELAYNYAIKMFVRDTMQFQNGCDESYQALLRQMSWLDIQNAYLYIFEKPVWHAYRTEFELPGHVLLKAVLRNGEVRSVSRDAQRICTADIYSHPAMPDERYTMALLPLYSNETIYGALLCDMRDKLFSNGEFLANQLSSAVKMIDLLNANEKIQSQLKDNLAALQQNNEMLDSLSKSDLLTGILNRRGFYAAAEKFLKDCKAAEKNSLVVYIDMDNLKIINDRYGHEEGDFALKAIGAILQETMGENGVAGRIGGDEFACVMEYAHMDEGRSVVEGIREKFRAFNKTSEKVYTVNVSVGTFLVRRTTETELNRALSLADEQLYLAKQSRKSEVEKQKTE